MTRPDSWGGPPPTDAGRPWPATAAYPNPPFPGAGQPAGFGPQQAYRPYPPPPYPGAWGGAGQQFPPGPPLPPAPAGRAPTTRRILGFILSGMLLLGLVGAAIAVISNSGTTSADRAAAPTDTAPTPGGLPSAAGVEPVVSVSLPPTIDGHQQIDNQYAQQLAETLRQQLVATGSDNAVVGLYGDAGQQPAFLVAASTTAYDSDLLLTGLAAGMQQSAGAEGINFVDQPAGPLGGTMRCATNGPAFTVCIWGVDGAFGMNMVYDQDLAGAAATTLKVREAVEVHAN